MSIHHDTGSGQGTGDVVPPGERSGQNRLFAASQIAAAFQVEQSRVLAAMEGEFSFDESALVDSKQAQHLAEVLLTEAPLDEREAALMRLGAFTPRPDVEWGVGDTPPGEESDRFAARVGTPEDELASDTGSHDPSQPHARS
jgi:hypothetical protein